MSFPCTLGWNKGQAQHRRGVAFDRRVAEVGFNEAIKPLSVAMRFRDTITFRLPDGRLSRRYDEDAALQYARRYHQRRAYT